MLDYTEDELRMQNAKLLTAVLSLGAEVARLEQVVDAVVLLVNQQRDDLRHAREVAVALLDWIELGTDEPLEGCAGDIAMRIAGGWRR